MATGEIVDSETLGGADMHSKISGFVFLFKYHIIKINIKGVSDFLAVNEYHAIKLAREIVYNLHYKKLTPLPIQTISNTFEEPFYDPGLLIQIYLF